MESLGRTSKLRRALPRRQTGSPRVPLLVCRFALIRAAPSLLSGPPRRSGALSPSDTAGLSPPGNPAADCSSGRPAEPKYRQARTGPGQRAQPSWMEHLDYRRRECPVSPGAGGVADLRLECQAEARRGERSQVRLLTRCGRVRACVRGAVFSRWPFGIGVSRRSRLRRVEVVWFAAIRLGVGCAGRWALWRRSRWRS